MDLRLAVVRKYSINMFTNEDIRQKYQHILVDSGLYPEILASGMGDFYFVGLFDDLNSALDFKSDVLKRKIE